MSSEEDDRWSPALNPYAIAVSQSWWAMAAVLQFAADAKGADGPAQQIYARQIFGHLRLLQRCAVMEAKELARLGVGQVHRDQLQDEIDLFESAVPGAKSARDILEHFDEYARGDGRLQRKATRRCSTALRCSSSRMGSPMARRARWSTALSARHAASSRSSRPG
jgi:hypothetical protein